MYKRRILFVGEASLLNSGFSNIYRSLLPRLVKTGKYEIAEHGSYADSNHPGINDFINNRWKFYPGLPSNPEENEKFGKYVQSTHPRDKGQNIAQFGAWNFDDVLIDFKPDIIVDIRDAWMMTWQLRSSFKDWLTFVWMPTVDSPYQDELWIQDYEKCDLVLAYSDFGLHTLKSQSPKIKLHNKPMRPGVDLDIFKPMNKEEVREKFNLSKDLFVIGACQRNQSVLRGESITCLEGNKKVENIQEGDIVLTSQGNLRKINCVSSYSENKSYTRLNIHGNTIFTANATSEHKFHFKDAVKPIGEAKIGDKIKVPILPLNKDVLVLDIADWIDIPKHWELKEKTIEYNWRGPKRSVDRYIEVNNNVMSLFGWYCAEGWVSGNNKNSTIQFGLDTKETDMSNEIIHLVDSIFGGHVGICDDKEYDSRTLSWASTIHARLFESLFGNGSRNKRIPTCIKLAPNSIYLAASYFEGDGWLVSHPNNDNFGFASYSHELAMSVRDILMSNGIFVNLNKTIEGGVFKTVCYIYKYWVNKFNIYLKYKVARKYENTQKERFVVDFCDKFFYVPIVNVNHTIESGPYFDFEVDEDFTYNVNGYACNNSRKNLLDVIDCFAMMKNNNPTNEKIQKSILLLHTSWPDNMNSFDYPRHIKRIQSDKWMKNHRPGIMQDIFQTLICHNCGEASVLQAIHLYGKQVQQITVNGKDIRGILLPCSYCGQQTATCPNTGIGVSREQLAEIYNLMDIFVQCSIAEGCGMTVQESKSCNVPVIVTDHSALSEKGRFPSEYVHLNKERMKKYTVNKGGITHEVAGYRHEPETGCLRAVTDLKDLSEKMTLLLTDDQLRSKMSEEALECATDNYNWDKISEEWERALDKAKIRDRSKTWDSPIIEVEPIKPQQVPAGLDNRQYVDWLYLNVLKYPKVDSEGAKIWLQNLAMGMSREQLMEQFVNIGNQQSDASRRRDELRSKKKVNKQEFI